MNRMESTSAAHLVKMTQPEEFDLVILGGGSGSSSPRLRLLEKATASPVVDRIHWPLLPQRRVPTQQEHHPQCEGGVLLSPKQGVWGHSRRFLRGRPFGSRIDRATPE
jgi:hypothetical protein